MEIFAGADVKAVLARNGNGTTIVVSFQSRASRLGMVARPFGAEFFAKYGIDAVLLTTSSNHWWQTDEMPAVLEAVRRETQRYERVVTYGSSMGAFGALAHSKAIGAHRIIAWSPVYSIDPNENGGDGRWTSDAAAFGASKYRVEDAAPEAETFLIFDNQLRDSKHAALIAAGRPNVTKIEVPFSGHPTTEFLKEIAVLSRFARELILSDVPDLVGIHHEIRAKRRQSFNFWRFIAKANVETRPRVSLAAARRAYELWEPLGTIREGLDIWLTLGLALARSGRGDEAFSMLDRALAARPNNPKVHAAIARSCLWLGERERGLRAVETVLRMRPHAAFLKLRDLLTLLA